MSLTIDGTTLAFVSCHLAAHEVIQNDLTFIMNNIIREWLNVVLEISLAMRYWKE